MNPWLRMMCVFVFLSTIYLTFGAVAEITASILWLLYVFIEVFKMVRMSR